MNRIHNASNRYQGSFKRVLCVCSAGLLRSPTAAWVLGQEPYNYNTRACGIDVGHALIPLDTVLLSWADEIVCMDADQEDRIRSLLQAEVLGGLDKKVINLRVPDNYAYRDPELVRLIKEAYNSALPAKGDQHGEHEEDR